MHNVTVANNSGGNSAVRVTGSLNDLIPTLTMSNTIVEQNTETSACNIALGSTFVNGGNNMTNGSGCTDVVVSDYLGLSSLADNGGSTMTQALLPGSPTIDAGNCAISPLTDQRGIVRPQVTTCDIGAYESRGYTLSLTAGTPQITSINTAFANPLELTVSSDYGEPVDGGQITFSAPLSGAGLTFTETMATVSNGAVSLPVTANGTAGSYNVTADLTGTLGNAIPYNLTNQATTATVTVTTTAASAITSTTAESGWVRLFIR